MMSGQLEGEFGWDAFGETEYPAAPEGLQINKNQAKLDALLSKPVKISGVRLGAVRHAIPSCMSACY